MTTYQYLNYSKNNQVVTITLNRPDEANGLNTQLCEELASAACDCDNDPSIKAVILTGNGRFFCAGGDVKAMANFGDRVPRELKRLADALHHATSTFARMKPPLIIAVNGIAAGAGFSLAVTGDLVLASEAANFTMAYTKVGLSPDGGASYFLPRLIGIRRTQELMFTNRTLSAEEALDWGMINRVVPAESLMQEAQSLADMFVQSAAGSTYSIKQLLLQTSNNTLETQLALESRYISACSNSPDGREGIGAFNERRKPTFE